MALTSRFSGVLSIIKDFGGYTSAHGLGRLTAAGHVLGKLFWFCAVVSAFGMFSWQTSRLFAKFYSRPVNVDVKVIFSELEFPAVTMCNLNRFRSDVMKQEAPELNKMVEDFGLALATQLSGVTQSKESLSSTTTSTVIPQTTVAPTTMASSPAPTTSAYGDEVEWSGSGEESTTSTQSTTTSEPMQTPTTTPKLRTTTPNRTAAPSLYDENEEYFIPTVNLTNKPWFNQTNLPDAQMEITKNITVALTTISASKRRQIGHQVSDMIQECSWNGKQCYPGNFTGFTNRYYGNCYTFNTGINASPVRSSKPGAIHGLRLTLFVEQDLYVETMSPSAGLRVLIHSRDVQPFPEEDGFDMSPGNKYSVGIRVREINRKGQPHGNCSDGDEATNRLLYKKKYSVTACLRSCAQDHKIARCGCGDPALPIPSGVSVCREQTHPGSTKCIEEIEDEINERVIICSCPVPCKQRVFVTSVSASEWPAAAYERVIKNQYSKRSERLKQLLSQSGGVRKQLLKLELFYEDLNYETITESPAYEEENLLGDIGGQLGLWIGLSILTLVELLELVFKIGKHLLGRNKIQEKTPTEEKELTMKDKESNVEIQSELYRINTVMHMHR